ncbi:Aldehyde ferredoxin oxidoreductase [Natrialba chahannaoensis JCM 10990]|uniref:Aldehyde ferredoxin oxidoreductase n=1 Tax=Natrialba chahannaoensis JCM 10990 TaxID=1227492 RepID=M0B531_9EURY|nr:aldehyde ferredoxin oxidoreductase family protein [Natrialba chahannaoensis]ELZ04759.1 Aldehyde ferredoxin oxidoreductase [Natrialba chahannaoensis JCM 10990]
MAQATVDTPEQVTQLETLVRVNLTDEQITTETVPQEYRDRFIAGKGLGAALLLDEVEAGVDPLSPENNLYFMFGPLTGFAPGTSRYGAVTKSPLTGTFVDSYSGGHFPTMVRYALPDVLAIAIEGRAENPMTLRITEGELALEDATELWGLDTKETARQFEGKQTKTACIGPAGENEVAYATISSDEGTHHAGRGGVGAVMGSKNLKAVVATGNSPPKAPDIQQLKVEHTQRLGTDDEVSWARNGGTQLIVDWTQQVGALPSHNWSRGTVENVDDLNIDAFSDGHVGTDSCFGCPVACGHVVDFEESNTDVDGAFPGASVDWGPEYETIGMMGANTDITNVTEVTELANLADTLGMDTISLGNVLSWLMEVTGAGLVDSDLRWGDAEAAAEVIHDIAHRDGIGDELAEGTARAADLLCDGHPDAREAAVQVKGLELPAYEPRASFSMALAYATADRGACHQRAFPIGSDALGGERDPHDTDGHAEVVIDEQDETALTYSMVSCSFTAYNYERVCEWLNELAYDVTVEDLEAVGERAWNATRLFNLREGFERDDDALPERFTTPLERGGPADGNTITEEQFETMLDSYYEQRGWTEAGEPTPETLARLDIESLAPESQSV